MRKQLIVPWPGPWKPWAEKYCRNNAWRFRYYLGEYEDAVAECALIYLDVRRMYGATVMNNKHFMALYKLTVNSWFNTYSVDDYRRRSVFTPMPEGELGIASTMDLDHLLLHKTRDSSPEVKEVVRLLLQAPTEAAETIMRDINTTKGFLKKIIKKAGINNHERVQNELRKAIMGEV